ncbi:hypothetical protein [Neobacillus cucumis]|uniref:hypothetical protein n=1 Tax=Neobacillus cucumis TaxID=1740721 RepID=UPI0028534F47|nr:hypothetical protein [Neobacillus cucumis]MDR4946486.1 hypothetical protein [Neobacillus cucumis]
MSFIMGMKDKIPLGKKETVLHHGYERQNAGWGRRKLSFIMGMKDKIPLGMEEIVLHRRYERQKAIEKKTVLNCKIKKSKPTR